MDKFDEFLDMLGGNYFLAAGTKEIGTVRYISVSPLYMLRQQLANPNAKVDWVRNNKTYELTVQNDDTTLWRFVFAYYPLCKERSFNDEDGELKMSCQHNSDAK